jgi:Flp pilus assembly protein TadD
VLAKDPLDPNALN